MNLLFTVIIAVTVIITVSFKKNVKLASVLFSSIEKIGGQSILNIKGVDPQFLDVVITDIYGRESSFVIEPDPQKGELIVRSRREFKPGKYQMQLKSPFGNTQNLEFNAGLLVANFDKDTYVVGDRVRILMSILDEYGNTVCGDSIHIQVLLPNGESKRLEMPDAIKKSDTCGVNNVTSAPDFETDFIVYSSGIYKFIIRDDTRGLSGEYTVNVYEAGSNPSFLIKRGGAVRINPFISEYDMSFTIVPPSGWSGWFVEKVPASFVIEKSSYYDVVPGKDDTKLIKWKISGGNDTYKVKYQYQAPKKSPKIFYLGRAYFEDVYGRKVYIENRIWGIASDAVGDGIGVIKSTQTTNSNNINDATAYPLVWDSSDLDGSYFAIDGTDTSKIIMQQDSSVFLSVSIPMSTSVARTTVLTEVFINGSRYDGAISESSYIRNLSGHAESSNDLSIVVPDLKANDYIQVYVSGTAATGTVILDGEVVMYLDALTDWGISASTDIYRGTSTQTTVSTNLNLSSAESLVWNDINLGATYTKPNPEEISFNRDGLYLISVNVPLYSTTARTNIRLQPKVNGSLLVNEGKQGYIRATSGHNNSSVNWIGVANVSSGDVLTVDVQQEAAAGTVTVSAGKVAALSIIPLPSSNIYIGEGSALSSGSNWNPSSADTIVWNTDDVIDSSVFSHTPTATTADQITVLQDGDYVLFYNDSMSSSVVRANNKITIAVNGTVVSSAETKTHYIRSTSGHSESSTMLVFPLLGLSSGDIITVRSQQEAGAGTVNDTHNALLMLWYKPVTRKIIEQTHFHWRNDDGDETGATSATSGNEDRPLFDIEGGQNYRLRLEVANVGNVDSGNLDLRLEYGASSNDSCASVTSWTDVAVSGGVFDMYDSTFVTDGDDTTNIAISGGGVTDSVATFLTPNGGVKDAGSTVSLTNLAVDNFIELEFSIVVNTAASPGTKYCFRVSNGGTPLDSYSKYATMTIKSDNDFKIQRGTIQVSGSSATITAGVDYAAPADINRAFIRITNTSYTGAGDDNSGGTQNANDVTVYIQNPTNLLSSITFARPAGAVSNTFVAWEIIEYVGPSGGDNEIVVRDQGTSTFSTTGLTVSTPTIAGVVDDNDVLPWVTAVGNPDGGTGDYNTGLVTSVWDASSDTATFTRGEAGSDATVVSWAIVEFVGANWKIQRVAHTYSAAGATETESITPVNDLSRAFLYTQKQSGSGLQGLDEYGHEVWLSAVDTVSFMLQSGSSTPSGQTSIAWVVENTQTNGVPMKVTRSSGTLPTGTPEPNTTIVSIGTTLADLSNASIFINNRSNGGGTAYPRPIIGAYIASTTKYHLWQSDTGQPEYFRTEIVEWPTATPLLTQGSHRIFLNQDSADVAGPLAAQNGVALGIPDDEPFRLRVLLHVGQKVMHTNFSEFRVESAEAVGSCDTSFTGETYTPVGPGQNFDYYDNPSVADASQLVANSLDPDDGNTTHNEDYVESNPFTNSYDTVGIGEDALFDVVLSPGTAKPGTKYCLRIVYNDGSLLGAYNFVASVFIQPDMSTMMRHGAAVDSDDGVSVLTF